MNLPSKRDRITIVGRTGGGKTQAALWHLSHQNFDTQPWVIFDYKMEDAINSIEGAEHIDVGYIPKHPGIYIAHPLPSQGPEVDEHLFAIWGKEKIGVYCDEGYMMGEGMGFLACLTQGRSKRIPMIVLTQRPVSISRFVFSEAQYFQIFSLNDKRDIKTVNSFAPIPFGVPLKEFHSYYYDVKKDVVNILKPVPMEDVTLQRIEDKLGARKGKRYL